MIIIKCILFIICTMFIIYRYGKLVGKIIGKHELKNILIYGVLLLFASNHLVLTPCIMLHTSFKTCCILMGITTIILIALSFWANRKEPKIKIDIKTYIKNTSILDKSIFVIMIVLVLFQMIASVSIFTENADDSYYVSLATSNIDSEHVYMEEPSMGYSNDEYSLLTPLERIPSYELSVAVYSKISGISTTIIFHTILPFIFIGISYLSYYYFARTMLNKRNSKIFIIILSVIMMFTAFTSKFRTGCLLYKMWQGKAIFLNVSLNIIIASLIRLSKRNNKGDIILLFLANLGSVYLSSTSIFIISFVYLAFGILKLIKLKIKDILYLVITFIPILVYVIILIFSMNAYTSKAIPPRDTVNIVDSLSLYGSTPYLIYYLISAVIIALIGNKEAKKYFVAVQIINLATIWNPLFSEFIAKYFTSSATFWRVFWLLPVETSIAYAITKILHKNKNIKIKFVILIICIIALGINGKFVYNNKSLAENLEKIPQYIIDQTNYILDVEGDNDNIIVLAPPEPLHSCTMRQLSSNIKLVYSRRYYRDKIRNTEDEKLRLELENLYYADTIEYTIEEFNNLFLDCNVDWVIVSEEQSILIDYLEKSIMEKQTTIDGYILYRQVNNDNFTNEI